MAEGGGGYRVEIAKTGRAGCKSNLCGRSKIERGQLRFGSFVDSGRFQSWMWRHWGCVTERVIQNVETKLEGNIVDNLDGFDEIEDEEVQQKIIRAFKQGHVDDEDVQASRSMAPEDDENEEEDTKDNLTTEEEEAPLEEVKGKRKHSPKTSSKKDEPNSSKKNIKKPKLEIVSDEEEEEINDDEEEDELPPENDDEEEEEEEEGELDDGDSSVKSPKKTIASERPKRSSRAPVKYAESGEEYSDSD